MVCCDYKNDNSNEKKVLQHYNEIKFSKNMSLKIKRKIKFKTKITLFLDFCFI